MKSRLIARLRHMLLGPGKHFRKAKRPEPEPARVTPDQFILMFSGQGADRKYYKEKNGVDRELRFW